MLPVTVITQMDSCNVDNKVYECFKHAAAVFTAQRQTNSVLQHVAK